MSAYRSDVVPLIGRDDVIAEMRGWLASGAIVSLRVLIGAGGRGKTRLALEFARIISMEGWLAGFVEQTEFDRFRSQQNVAVWGWDTPTLIIVDYAASRAEQLQAWLRELVDGSQAAGRPRLRILLIERQAQRAIGWLSTVVGHGSDDTSRAAIALLDPPEPMELPAIDDLSVRHRIFTTLLDKAPGDLKAPPLGVDAEFDRLLRDEKWAGDPLFLMMAGLVAGERGVAAALSLSRSDLALNIGGRELDRIGKIAAAHGVDAQHRSLPGALARHIAVLTTLVQGLALQAARSLVEGESRRLGSPAPVSATLDALGDALPSQSAHSGIAPILPDIVGEAAILLWLGDDGPIKRWGLSPAECIAAAARVSLSNVSQVLVRTAQDFAAGGRVEPVNWLDGLVSASDADIGALMQIADTLPQQTLVLRERAADLHARIADRLRAFLRAQEDAPPPSSGDVSLLGRLRRVVTLALGGKTPPTAESEEMAGVRNLLAASLNNLGVTLGNLGRREEALDAAREAVDIRRRLAAARPDAFLPDLAGSLNNLGGRLGDLGRREEALEAAREAVEIYRRLAAARPDAFLPEFASSLNNLGNRLSEIGRREEAL
ncbi:MAG TPA: tetratricopeptide repeat protein, partial [Methylocystis sp.]